MLADLRLLGPRVPFLFEAPPKKIGDYEVAKVFLVGGTGLEPVTPAV